MSEPIFNAVVLGLGASGEGAARLLRTQNRAVTVLDTGSSDSLQATAEKLRAAGITVVLGESALAVPRNFPLVVISPGLDPASALAQPHLASGAEVIGELELAWRACAKPVVAITGTNGKTTTTELIEAMFNAAEVRTKACGNIGPAFSAHVSDEVDLVTLEVSSFQLERITSFRPRISVWLNLTPDHLDRYPTMAEYRAAKLRIFENQTPADVAVVNLRDELPAIRARKITFSAFVEGGDFSLREGVIHFESEPVLALAETQLRGLHNAENLMAALGVGYAWGLSFEQMIPALKAYRPAPHRCELVRELDGVRYVNDSKATNLDALEKALISETSPLVLIAGGKDKGFEFESITELVGQKAHDVVLIGEMSERIDRFWSPVVPCARVGSLVDAVSAARSRAARGDVVLFSPGTSSFDMFRNYADRGDQFRRAVQALT